MTLGKVTVTESGCNYHIRIGVGDDGYLERITFRRADAYSDVKFQRSMFKRYSQDPYEIVKHLGYTLVKDE